MAGDWLGNALRARSGQCAGHSLVPPTDKQEEQATTPSASPEGGFGGGMQGATVPEGETFNDQVRRRVFGG
jgi:hypothetical protein